jgi:hypothetical protein
MNTGYDASGLKKTAHSLERIILQDPGKRGLDKWGIKGGLFTAAESLVKGRSILLATGFYIVSAGVIETDGPPGAAVLALALEKMGMRVTILTDDHAEEIMKTSLESIGSMSEVRSFKCGENPDINKILDYDTTHFIALERPGRSADGFHYNFRGVNISSYLAPFDEAYIEAQKRGITTIAIGDGGNELGMGDVGSSVDKYVAPGRAFSCGISSDICICAGVSNWAGYALAAMLSRIAGENLMADRAVFDDMLKGIVNLGAVDGVSGLKEVTVDGLDLSWEERIYMEMYKAASGEDYIPGMDL